MENVVVLGAGVIGLECALALRDAGYSVRIVARELPSDSNNNAFASPFAGANILPFEGNDCPMSWERDTYAHWETLIPGGVATYLPTKMFLARADQVSDTWGHTVVKDYVRVPGNDKEVHFTTVSVSAPDYILYLTNKLKERHVSFEQRAVTSLDELDLQHNDILVNATALGARSLGGVQDENVYPVRGQTVIVHAPDIKECIIDMRDKTAPAYIIPRPTGDVVLGGTFDSDNTALNPDIQISQRILTSCYALDPRLTDNNKVNIKGACVGFRPARKGGPRVERQGNIIHAYGFGSRGFQCGKGVAVEVLALARSSK